MYGVALNSLVGKTVDFRYGKYVVDSVDISEGIAMVRNARPDWHQHLLKADLTDIVERNIDLILDGINKYLLRLAEDQIRLAFAQSEKEVQDLRQRTREGIETARISGKQIGGITGRKFTIKPQDIPNSECPAAVNIGI